MDYIWIILNPPAVIVFPKPSWKILFGSRETSVTEKELPVHTFPQGMWLTPISILFWWKLTSQKTSRLGSIPLVVAIYPPRDSVPPDPKPSLPCLMASKNFPGGTPHAVHHLRPRFPLTFIPQTATSEEAARGSMHSAEGAPESGYLEGPTSPPAARVGPDSDLNGLRLVSPSVKWEELCRSP